MSKRGIIQLSEFDINQKIIESLSNVCTRSVLFSVKDESKDVTQIANELKISLSTVYKTLSTLEDLALAEVDRYVISPEGKKNQTLPQQDWKGRDYLGEHGAHPSLASK